MQSFSIPLHAIIQTSDPEDFDRLAAQLQEQLRKSGFETRATPAGLWADFALALDAACDVILADLDASGENIRAILKLLDQRGLDIPVILLVKPEQEAAALDCMELGAADYLFKDRPGRLGAAVCRSLHRGEWKEQPATTRSRVLRYQALFEHTQDIILFARPEDGRILDANRAAEAAYGYAREELLNLHIADLRPPETDVLISPTISPANGSSKPHPIRMETVQRRKDGSTFPVEVQSVATCVDGERVNVRIVRDIREQKTTSQLLAKMFSSLDQVILVQDPTTRRVLQISAAARQVLGFDPEELVGRTTEFLYSDMEEYIASGEEINTALEKHGVLYGEQRMRRKDGSVIYVDVSITTIRDEMGQRLVNIGTIRDITERKQTELALAESEARYRRLVELAPVGIAVHCEGSLVFVNATIARLLGASSPEALVGRSIAEFVPPETMQMIMQRVKAIYEGNMAPALEEKIIRADGSLLDAEIVASPITYQGKPAVLLVGTDISERKQVQQALAESEERYRRLVEMAPVGIAIYNAGEFIFANPAVARLLGASGPEQIVNKTILDFATPETVEKIRHKMWELETGFEGGPFEGKIAQLDGSQIDAEIIATTIPYQNRTAFLLVGRDVSDRKTAEEALRASETKFRALVEQNTEGVVLFDEQCRIIEWNQALERMSGILREEAQGQFMWDLQFRMALPDKQTPERRDAVKAGMISAVQTGQSPMLAHPYETIIQTPDGERRYIQQISFPIKTGLGYRIGSILRDITERKLAEQKLLESEARYRRLFEDAVLGVFQSTPEGGVIAVNPSFARMFGYDSPEDVLATVKNVSTDIFADPNRRSKVARMAEGGHGVKIFENAYRRKDGSTFLGMLYLHPVTNPDGSVHHFEGMIEDITQRKAAEHDLQRRMIELETMHQVALAGSEATSLDELIVRVVDIVKARLFPDEFGLAFIDEGEGTLTYHPSAYTSFMDLMRTIPISAGISGSVVRSGQPRRAGNVRMDPEYINANPQTRSELCVPLTLNGKVIGVINAESQKLNYFTEADERLMVAVAGELATAIEKIRLLEAERDRRQELESLAEISAVVRAAVKREEMLPAILERMLEVLNASGAAIAIRDAHSGELVFELGGGDWQAIRGIRMPANSGIGGEVVATRQVIYVQQPEGPDPRMFRPTLIGETPYVLCLPLITDEQVSGLLYLGRSREFQPSDMRLAKATADIIASAFHRVQLYEETERQLERLTALRAIDQSILSTPELEKTLDILLEKFTGLLKVDAADFLLYEPQARRLIVAAERGLPSTPIWEASNSLANTHAGLVAMTRKMDFVPNLEAIEDNMTRRIRFIGERFTSYLAMPLIAKGELKGVMQIFNRTPLDPAPDWMDFLQALTDQAAIAIDNAQMFKEQQQTNRRLTEAYDATIEGWSRALDMRDRDTEGHSQRVTELTLRLARRMGVSEEDLAHIRRGAQLHDIGKMGIPDNILLKAGLLTKEEWRIMRKHPVYALDFLSPIEFLLPALEIPYCHHEKWDGSGYPRGLKGDQIPLSARIFAVVDVWDALTSDRPYRPAWPREKVLEHIREQSGTHFDPQVVEHFMEALG